MKWHWVGSDVLDFEVARCPDLDRRTRLGALAGRVHSHVALDEALRERGRQIAALGFRPLDALHLASAEPGGADVLLTTDDRLPRAAARGRRPWIVEVLA